MRKNIFVIGLCIILFKSCAVDDGSVTFFNVNEDHTIGLSQTLTNNGGSLVFELETNQQLKCDNLVLNHTINQNDETVTIWLNGYDNSKKCSLTPGIIKSTIPLKPFYQELKVKIIMKYESAVEKNGWIKVSDGTYSLKIDDDFGIKSKNNQIRIVEPNTYWGQVWSSDSLDVTFQSKISDLTKKYGFVSLKSGDYTFFTAGSGFVSLHDQASKPASFSFAGNISKSGFNQFLSELSAFSNTKYLIRSYDDKKFER